MLFLKFLTRVQSSKPLKIGIYQIPFTLAIDWFYHHLHWWSTGFITIFIGDWIIQILLIEAASELSNSSTVDYGQRVPLKVVGNQKVGGSGMCQSVPICLGPRRSMFFSLSNFAVIFDFIYVRFCPSKAKWIVNVIPNRRNAAIRSMFFFLLYNEHCLLTHRVSLRS
jgi:hypothetical protein